MTANKRRIELCFLLRSRPISLVHQLFDELSQPSEFHWIFGLIKTSVGLISEHTTNNIWLVQSKIMSPFFFQWKTLN